MVLALSDFDQTGLEVGVLGLINSGGAGLLIYRAGVNGSIADPASDMVLTSTLTINRIRYNSGVGQILLNRTGGGNFTDEFGSGDDWEDGSVYVQTDDGLAQWEPSELNAVGGGFVRWNSSDSALRMIMGDIGSGDVIIFAIAKPGVAAEDASFSATAGDPTATFSVTFTAAADSEAAFDATAGDPTATFGAEAIIPANAGFEATAGDPTATFGVEFFHTSVVSFSARAGDPTAAFTPTFTAAADSDASFAARAGSPTATFGVEALIVTGASFEATAGDPTATFAAEVYVRVIPPGSWAQLESIVRENLRYQEWEAAQPPE